MAESLRQKLVNKASLQPIRKAVDCLVYFEDGSWCTRWEPSYMLRETDLLQVIIPSGADPQKVLESLAYLGECLSASCKDGEVMMLRDWVIHGWGEEEEKDGWGWRVKEPAWPDSEGETGLPF